VSKDAVYLKHILDEAHFLMAASKGMKKTSLERNPTLQRAFARSLEIIGEAVKNLSDDFKQRHPAIDWRGIAGLRDKLIHHYFSVDWDVVWDTIKRELPRLEKMIAQTLLDMDEPA
jgi:uncharacterized protein with HEPN domain